MTKTYTEDEVDDIIHDRLEKLRSAPYIADYFHDQDNLVEAIHVEGVELIMSAMHSAQVIYSSNDTISEMVEEIPRSIPNPLAQIMCAIYIGRLWEWNAQRKAIEVVEIVKAEQKD